jgi:YegS/Rv2252/BmrU family lipid kinase
VRIEEEMSGIKVIANPLAGRGRGRHTTAAVSRWLPQKGIRFDLTQTEYAGHAVELARDAVAEGYKTIVALGGDGTVNEVVNGLCRDLGDDPNPADVVTLGVIPSGSGNDFAYAVGVPLEVKQAVDLLAEGRTRLVDMGRINGRLFAYGVGLGFDAEVNIESQKIRVLRGMLLYFVALMKVLIFQRRVYEIEMTVDDVRIKQQAIMISVANGRRFAGAFLITPDAEIDDGLLDLCVVSPVSRLEMLRYVPMVFTGDHTRHGAVKMFAARQVRIQSESPLASHVDGEVFGLGERCYQLSLLPQRLRVIY